VVFSPGTITGGDGRTATGTVTLEANAAPGDITVTLSSAKPEVAQPSVSLLVIPAGQQTGTFATTPEFVSASTTVSFTAAANGLSKKKSLTVKPVAVALLALTPSTVQGGSPSSGDVTLNYPAGPAGVTVTFSSSNSAVAAPASPSITIPQGQSAASVAVATQPVGSSTGVTITAAGGGVSKAKLLTVTP
jgi:hypothetical protein